MPRTRRCRVPAIGLGLLLGATGHAAAVTPDPFFPRHGNVGVDVQHYDLQLRVGTQPNELRGVAALRIRATRALDAFRLDLHGLTVTRVDIDDEPAAFEQTGDKLAITLPAAVPRGDRFTAVVRYAGEADPLPDPSIEPGGDLTLGWRTHGRSSFVVSEPVGASTWFPCNDDLKDRATYRISVDVPAGFVAAANGRRLAVDDLGQRRRYRFEMNAPMTTWNATVNVHRYEIHRSRSSNGIPVTVYATASASDAAVRGYTAAKDMLPYFAARFGRYPYDRYASVALSDPSVSFALEAQTISLFPERWYSSDVVAHELAHQWFGNAVAVQAWKHLWLAEGFATYAEVLWPNRRNPTQFHAVMRAMHAQVQRERLGPVVVESAEQMFSLRTYFRGATVLYALQLKIGQAALFEVLKAWTTRYRGRTVTTDDFVDTVVDVTGDATLRDFLQPWIYAQQVPALPGSRVPPAGEDGQADVPNEAARRWVAMMAAHRHRAR